MAKALQNLGQKFLSFREQNRVTDEAVEGIYNALEYVDAVSARLRAKNEEGVSAITDRLRDLVRSKQIDLLDAIHVGVSGGIPRTGLGGSDRRGPVEDRFEVFLSLEEQCQRLKRLGDDCPPSRLARVERLVREAHAALLDTL